MNNSYYKSCTVCSEPFYAPPSRQKNHTRDCCSRRCRNNKSQTIIKNGGKLSCKHHGFHTQWRIVSAGERSCILCARKACKTWNEKNRLSAALAHAKTRAKQFNREIDVDLVFLKELLLKQHNRCAISGRLFDNIPISIDRINSKKGYTKDNIHLVITEVNVAKMDMNLIDFIKLCNDIALYNSTIFSYL